jgi:hypothetical protein
MNIPYDTGFFILSDELTTMEGSPVCIVVDHNLVLSLRIDSDLFQTLGSMQKEFVLWYQEEVYYKTLLPPVTFIVNPSNMKPYDQEKICKEILDFLDSPAFEDIDLF